MKKIKYLLLLLVIAFITTGCIKFNVNMDIKKNKSMEFSIIYAVDKSLLSNGGGLNEGQFDDAKKMGFTVSKYSQDNYEGFRLTRKISNIDEVSSEDEAIFDISSLMGKGEESKYIFKVEKGEEKNTYSAKIKFNSNDSGMDFNATGDEKESILTTGEDEMSTTTIGEDEEVTTTSDDDTIDLAGNGSDYDISGMMGNLDLSFNVTLPYSALSSNATTTENDNKKLTWKLGTSGDQYIEFTFELNNNESDSNILLYVGIGVILLAVVIVLILVFNKKKSVVKNTMINNDTKTTKQDK